MRIQRSHFVLAFFGIFFLQSSFTNAQDVVCKKIREASQTKLISLPKGCSFAGIKYNCFGILLENTVCVDGEKLGNLVLGLGRSLAKAQRVEQLLFSKFVNKEEALAEAYQTSSGETLNTTTVFLKPVVLKAEPIDIEDLTGHSIYSLKVRLAKMDFDTVTVHDAASDSKFYHLESHYYRLKFPIKPKQAHTCKSLH